MTGPTHFFIRANAVTLFPLVLLVFLLGDHHVESPVGKRVAWVFTLFHGLALLLIIWYRLNEPWHLEPFWGGVAFHGGWFLSGAAALMGY